MADTKSDKKQAQYGIFFDGTGNNYYVDNKFADDTFEPTNIAKLFELYQQDDHKNIGKQYINGIGTRDVDLKKSGDDAEYSNLEMAFGIGIRDRVEEAVKGIREFLEVSNQIDSLNLDIFGFSRGAATARILVNKIHQISQQDPAKWLNKQVNIRFLGIFDTVGSIGISDDGENAGYNLNLHPDAVHQAFHITAHDEFRKYFPLSSLKSSDGQTPANFTEKELLGAHSDIGGGYGNAKQVIYLDSQNIIYGGRPDRKEKQRLQLIEKTTQNWKTEWQDYLNGKWKAADGEIEVKVRREQKNGPEGQPNSHKQLLRYIWNREVNKQLSHVSLQLMLEHARKIELPLMGIDALRDLAKPLDSDIPSALADYAKAVNRGEDLLVEKYLSLYPEFIHHSHQFRAPEGGLGLVNANANKGELRQVLYNRPNEGLHS